MCLKRALAVIVRTGAYDENPMATAIEEFEDWEDMSLA